MTPMLRRGMLGFVGLVIAMALSVVPAAMVAAEDAPRGTPPSDDALVQVIDPNQAQGTGQVVVDDGHIDFGPTLNTGEWIVQIHDDTATPSCWRMPKDVVAKVNDASKLTVPDNEDYSFLGLEPGSEVWVVPQVRKPGSVWTGWNTQEPKVLDALATGMTLKIHDIEGPGEVTAYLQSGNFGAPEPLWSTLTSLPKETWIEANSHTHANWVFSEPGVYLVEVEFIGDLKDGRTVSARDTLRFAVGDQTDPAAAFTAQLKTPSTDGKATPTDMSPDSQQAAAADGTQGGEGSSDGNALLLGAVAGVVGAALMVAVVIVAIAAARARTKVRQEARTRAAERHDERQRVSIVDEGTETA